MDAAIREHVGIVFQGSVLDRKLTVEENLMTRGSFYGYTKKEVRERLQKFWEFFELNDIWKQRYEKLSGGQRRRVDVKSEYEADHYRITLTGNPAEFLYQNRGVIKDYEVLKGTMDDVFMALTGKGLQHA